MTRGGRSTGRRDATAAPAAPSALDANRLGALWATLDHALGQAMADQSASSSAILLWLQHWAPVGVVELGRVVGLSQPACTRALDKLVEQGLVARETVSGKQVQLTLTRSGLAQARQLQKRRLQACGELLAALSPTEQAQFARLADKLLQAPVEDRAYARHVCRFCDHAVCDGPDCPIGCQASAIERAAAGHQEG
ncbi:MarR family winged helix-turn-helix transcriptional regulator [Aquabacterium sp.]|uniref:MarR family winged helix-turn-helix transcriptional regulator n=1 Tax=Aquabacterium sp. TaxID=1872578 RepID=UPI00378390F1